MTEGGFTLLELIVVVTIIAMLSAGVMPIFRGTFVSVANEHGTRNLEATIRYAQESAIANSCEYRIYISQEDNAYYLMRLKSVEHGKKEFEAVEDPLVKKMVLPERLKFKTVKGRTDRKSKSKEKFIGFYPNGACDEAQIVLSRKDGKNIEMKMKGPLGHLEVKEPK